MTSRSCALGMGILVIIFELSLVASLQRSEVFFLNFHRLAFQFSQIHGGTLNLCTKQLRCSQVAGLPCSQTVSLEQNPHSYFSSEVQVTRKQWWQCKQHKCIHHLTTSGPWAGSTNTVSGDSCGDCHRLVGPQYDRSPKRKIKEQGLQESVREGSGCAVLEGEY